jgi:hypothetical protein
VGLSVTPRRGGLVKRRLELAGTHFPKAGKKKPGAIAWAR